MVYCEIDSFLPVREEFEFLRKISFKRMGRKEGFQNTFTKKTLTLYNYKLN